MISFSFLSFLSQPPARDAGLLEGDAPTAHVAMDCCIFDRILLYLEAAAAGPEAIESFIAKVLDLPTAEELLQPSKLLGCGGENQILFFNSIT